jgi:hypothetical protein
LPQHTLDLYVEFRTLTNGLVALKHTGLVEVLQRYHLPSILAAEKAAMIDQILAGGPWTREDQAVILRYCASDIEVLRHLLPAMLPSIAVPQALERGRYVRNAAIVEQRGIPLDQPLRTALAEQWEPLQDALISAINPQIGYAYKGRHFQTHTFATWVAHQGYAWPRTPKTQQPRLDKDTLKMMAMLHPELEPFRQLRKSLGQMRLTPEHVGHDGYNRPGLRPFSAVTGRNLPKTKENILGAAAWMRSLIQPPPGYGMAYLDWSLQEYAIVAVLSHDSAMLQDYLSGDPYISFGQRVGAIPTWGTKATHGPIRDLYKACSLGVLYGMGAGSLAQRIGKSRRAGYQLLHHHQKTYRNFWGWADHTIRIARRMKRLSTMFGWHVHWDPAHAEADCPSITAGTIRNFPAQGHGSEMLRMALSFAVEAGVEVCSPLHDAFLIQAPVAELDEAIHTMRKAMDDASEVILQGFRLRTDAQVFTYPQHFRDPRGDAMWDIIRPLLPQDVCVPLAA